MPIHANSLPIAYQSSVNPCQSFVNLGPFQGQYSRSTTIFQSANLGQAMPIRQSSANPCQSVPIRCQSANPRPIGQSQANPPIRCQSYVITEAIPALNLGTSALYGEVSSLLGGRFRAKAPARTGAATQGLSTIAAHFLPIWRQSKPIQIAYQMSI